MFELVGHCFDVVSRNVNCLERGVISVTKRFKFFDFEFIL